MFRDKLRHFFQEAGQYAGALPVSYSRVQTLLRCPFLFNMKYVQKIKAPSEESDALRIGKKAHMLMEHSMRNVRASGDYTVDGSGFITLHSYVVSNAPESQAAVLQGLKEPMLDVLSRLLRLAALDGTSIATERKISVDREAQPTGRYRPYALRKPEVGFLGYVDLELKRGSQMNIVDYKTEMPTDARREEVIRQTGLYACMEFMLDSSLSEINTYCIYLKDGTVDKTAAYSRDRELPALENEVLTMCAQYLEALRENSRQAVPNRYCEYCEYRGTGYCGTKEV